MTVVLLTLPVVFLICCVAFKLRDSSTLTSLRGVRTGLHARQLLVATLYSADTSERVSTFSFLPARDIGETLLSTSECKHMLWVLRSEKTQVFLERWAPRGHRWSSSFWKRVFVHFHVVLLPNVMLNSIQVNHLWMHTVVIYFLLISFVKGLLLLEHKSSLWASCQGGGKWLNHRWAHACWSAWMTNLSKASRQKSL